MSQPRKQGRRKKLLSVLQKRAASTKVIDEALLRDKALNEEALRREVPFLFANGTVPLRPALSGEKLDEKFGLK